MRIPHLCVVFLLLLLLWPGQGGQAQPAPPELLFWHYYPDERGQALDALVTRYNRDHPDALPLRAQHFAGYDQLHDAMLSALVNGTAPNLLLIQPYHAALYQLSGAVVDLQPYLADSGLKASDFYPQFWQQGLMGNALLGIPLTRAYAALYVNLDALREMGYAAPPQTRAEFAAMSCAYRGWSRYHGVVMGAGEAPLDAAVLLGMAGDAPLFPPAADTQGSIQPDLRPLDELLAFFQAQLSQRCLSFSDPAQAQNRFASGQTPFFFASSAIRAYVADAIAAYYAEPFAWTLRPVPGPAGPNAYFFGSNLSLLHHDAVQDAAGWQFIEWMAQPAQLAAWAAASDTIPARRTIPFADDLPDNSTWNAEPALPAYTLIRDEISFAARGLYLGGDRAALIENAAVTANAILNMFTVEDP